MKRKPQHCPSQDKPPLLSLCTNHHIVDTRGDRHPGALKRDGLCEQTYKTGKRMAKKKVEEKTNSPCRLPTRE